MFIEKNNKVEKSFEKQFLPLAFKCDIWGRVFSRPWLQLCKFSHDLLSQKKKQCLKLATETLGQDIYRFQK